MTARPRRARHARRQTERATRKAAQGTPDRALHAAAEMANLIGPHIARRFGGLVAIKQGVAGAPVEVFAIDRWSGAPRCWGCGDELGDDVVGTTMLNAEVTARDPDAPMVLIRQCDGCAREAAAAATGSAKA